MHPAAGSRGPITRMSPPLKPAEAYIPATGYSDHSLNDARSLALHCKIAYKIDRDSALLEKVRENLARWRENHEPGRIPRYQEEWEQILTAPAAYCGISHQRHRGRHPAQVILAVYRDPDSGGTSPHLRGVQPGLNESGRRTMQENRVIRGLCRRFCWRTFTGQARPKRSRISKPPSQNPLPQPAPHTPSFLSNPPKTVCQSLVAIPPKRPVSLL